VIICFFGASDLRRSPAFYDLSQLVTAQLEELAASRWSWLLTDAKRFLWGKTWNWISTSRFFCTFNFQSFANVRSTPDRQPPVCLMRFSNGLPLLSCRFRSRRRATLQHHRWECRWKIKPGSKSMKRNTHQIWDNFCRAFFMKAAQTQREILPNCRIWIGFEEFFLSLWRLRGSKVRFLGYWDRPHGLNTMHVFVLLFCKVDFLLHHEHSCWFGLVVWMFPYNPTFVLCFCLIFLDARVTRESRVFRCLRNACIPSWCSRMLFIPTSDWGSELCEA